MNHQVPFALVHFLIVLSFLVAWFGIPLSWEL